jgi:hypothetical protein
MQCLVIVIIENELSNDDSWMTVSEQLSGPVNHCHRSAHSLTHCHHLGKVQVVLSAPNSGSGTRRSHATLSLLIH